MRKTPPALQSKVRHLLAHGATIDQVCEATNISRSTVYRLKYGIKQTKEGAIKTMKAPTPRKRLTRQEKEQLLQPKESHPVAIPVKQIKSTYTPTVKFVESAEQRNARLAMELHTLTSKEVRLIVRAANKMRAYSKLAKFLGAKAEELENAKALMGKH